MVITLATILYGLIKMKSLLLRVLCIALIILFIMRWLAGSPLNAMNKNNMQFLSVNKIPSTLNFWPTEFIVLKDQYLIMGEALTNLEEVNREKTSIHTPDLG